jgi:SecD/SecF fusion protein
MQKSQISEMAVEKVPNEPNHYALMIKFNQFGKTDWANLTKTNIGKSIAMVIDNKVYSAPRVMTEIKNGACMIARNFTLKEITRLKSLINNAELPLDFKLIN